MAGKARKVFVVGMDGMMSPMWKRFTEEGILPNLKRIADEGVSTESYCVLPVWTPTNWATLMTGANTGTHSVSRWFVNTPHPRNAKSTVSAFVGNAVTAETVFEALDRAGLKSVAIHYPASGPSRAPMAHTIDPFGHPEFGSSPFEVTPAHGYTNLGDVQNSYRIELQPARRWKNLPNSNSPPLEFPVPIVTKKEGENQTLVGLAIDSGGRGLDTVVLCAHRDGATELGRSKIGQWSPWINREFTVEGKSVPATFRIRTVELAPDGSRLRLYRSQVMYREGFTEPPELAQKLTDRFGPYLEHASIYPLSWGVGDLETALDEVDYHCTWTVNVGNYLLHEEGYSLLYTHIHLFDYLNHEFLADMDPSAPGYDREKSEFGWKVYREAYKVADRLFGKLLEAADDETAIVIVSDHAAYPQKRAADPYKLLQDNGFLVLKEGFNKRFYPSEAFDQVDMERTKVFMMPDGLFELFINAPEGSDEYTQIQTDVLTLLRSWVDKERNQTPVVLALPRQHASLLGFWGEQCGDIVFFMEDGYVAGYPSAEATTRADPYVWAPAAYGGHHGPYLPTARTEIASNMGVFIARAPGFKSGYERPVNDLGYISQMDLVPIVCHLLGVEPPDQAQGTVPRDFFEGTKPVFPRLKKLPDWEKGTNVNGFGDRVWTRGGDMVAAFFVGESADPQQ